MSTRMKASLAGMLSALWLLTLSAAPAASAAELAKYKALMVALVAANTQRRLSQSGR